MEFYHVISAMIPIQERISSVSANEHVYHAMYKDTTISSVAECVAACTGNCLAVDFDEEIPACFFHNITSACRRSYALPDEKVLHIKLVPCGRGSHAGRSSTFIIWIHVPL